MIAYVCKYTPVELLEAFGAETRELNLEADNFDYAQTCTHMNMCSHIKALIETVHTEHVTEMVLINDCDSTRRAYDVLKDKMDFLFLMDLPHTREGCAREHLIDELMRLADAYQEYSGKTFNFKRFEAAFHPDEEETREPGPYIAVIGGRAGDKLMEHLRSVVPLPVRNLTCNSLRKLGLPPSDPKDALSSETRKLSEEAQEQTALRRLMTWYADELMSQMPCLRMADITRRRELIEDPDLRGIIYHTVKFCDFYSFEYERMRRRTDLPILKIETDFTMQSAGQLSTRIGGFVESLGLRKEKRVARAGKYYAGIDSGSTTTNVAVIDEAGNLVDSAIVRTGAKAQRGAENAFAQLSLVDPGEIAMVIATGYGRKNISFADDDITEITCHARGAHHLDPEVRTIIDIGGQDNKAIALDENGLVKNFAMNDKCAAGTGRFLENMAKVLEISLDEISEVGLAWEEDLVISSMCTVFAESEVVSLIADNKQIPDIVHGLNKSVAAKTMTLVRRVRGTGKYMMTGGGARNKGVVQAISEMLGEEVRIPKAPDLCGALGAALFARDQAKESGGSEQA